MKFFILLLFVSSVACAQAPKAEDFGFRHLQTVYKGLPVDVLIQSKKGDEHKRKPIFLFVQGSLPTPLIIIDKAGKPYHVFVFKTDSMLEQYHLAIIGKPGVPVIARDSDLTSQFVYLDPKTGLVSRVYQENNYINYLAERDKQVIKFLRGQDFAADEKVVIAGHSEGGTVAAKLALICGDVGKLIYASENPLGRLFTEIGDARDEDPGGKDAEDLFKGWKETVDHPDDTSRQKGDTDKGNYQASLPAIEDLKKLKIPVLVSYGTKDHSGKYCDFLQLEMIRLHKSNFTFKSYLGLDHNYFPFKADGSVNYDIFNWDKVALDWQDWLAGKTALHSLQ